MVSISQYKTNLDEYFKKSLRAQNSPVYAWPQPDSRVTLFLQKSGKAWICLYARISGHTIDTKVCV
jgi:hypothetical protein